MEAIRSTLFNSTFALALLATTAAQALPAARPMLSDAQHTVGKKVGKFIAAALNGRYYWEVVKDKRGEISAKEPAVVFLKVRLERGVHYRFGARGDADALDLDMQLRDASGQVVRSDTDPDAEPGFDFLCDATGDYFVIIEWTKGSGARRTQVGVAVLARHGQGQSRGSQSRCPEGACGL
jgi:hypothetical protein